MMGGECKETTRSPHRHPVPTIPTPGRQVYNIPMSLPEKILIVGGQGATGAWIAKVLIEEGAGFLLFERRPDNSVLAQVLDPDALPAVRRVFGDPRDARAIARAI